MRQGVMLLILGVFLGVWGFWIVNTKIIDKKIEIVTAKQSLKLPLKKNTKITITRDLLFEVQTY